jgi:hypothetical protein
MTFMTKLLPCAGYESSGERFGALFSFETRLIRQSGKEVERQSQGFKRRRRWPSTWNTALERVRTQPEEFCRV